MPQPQTIIKLKSIISELKTRYLSMMTVQLLTAVHECPSVMFCLMTNVAYPKITHLPVQALNVLGLEAHCINWLICLYQTHAMTLCVVPFQVQWPPFTSCGAGRWWVPKGQPLGCPMKRLNLALIWAPTHCTILQTRN